MNKNTILTIIAVIAIGLISFAVTQDKIIDNLSGVGGDGTIYQLAQWVFDGTNITQNVTDTPVKITGLESEDCIGTDANGVLQSGTCTGGGGSSEWTDNGAELEPNEGEGIKIDYVIATSTATSSSFNNASSTLISGTTAWYTSFIGALTGNVTGDVTGNADTATALAANGANCTAGNAPLGVDASGAVESCFDVWTEAENTSAGYIANVVEDTTPQLGGELDAQDNNITSVSNITLDSIQADSTSGGIGIKNNAGTNLFTIGAGGAASTNIGIAGNISSSLHAQFTDYLQATGNSTNAGRLRLGEDSDNGSNYAELIAPSSITSNYVINMPSTAGTLALTSELHDAVTLGGEDYLSISTQLITANAINPDNLASADFGDFTCNGTSCSLDATYLQNVVEDTTPTLGGDLDGGSFDYYNIATGAIGTSTTERLLSVYGNVSTAVAEFIRTTSSATNIAYGTFLNLAIHDGNMGENFGSAFQFAVEDNANVQNIIANIQGLRGDTDDSGKLNFVVYNDGTPANGLTIDEDQSVTFYEQARGLEFYPSFTYATTSWTGTTTLPLGPAFNAQEWNAVKCFTDVGTLYVQFNDGTNDMNDLQASTTVGTVPLTTNNTFTASEKRYVDVGTPASSPTKISCTVSYDDD